MTTEYEPKGFQKIIFIEMPPGNNDDVGDEEFGLFMELFRQGAYFHEMMRELPTKENPDPEWEQYDTYQQYKEIIEDEEAV